MIDSFLNHINGNYHCQARILLENHSSLTSLLAYSNLFIRDIGRNHSDQKRAHNRLCISDTNLLWFGYYWSSTAARKYKRINQYIWVSLKPILNTCYSTVTNECIISFLSNQTHWKAEDKDSIAFTNSLVCFFQ